MTRIVKIVVGNPAPASRTRAIAERLVQRLFEPTAIDVQTIDLADYAGELFDFASQRVSALNSAVAAADLVVFATPTYKGTYTGLLKAFLDRYSTDGLLGVIALPVMTGGSIAHSLAVNDRLAPLLLELGATIPGRGLYVPMDRESEFDAIIDGAAKTYAENLGRLTHLASAVVSDER